MPDGFPPIFLLLPEPGRSNPPLLSDLPLMVLRDGSSLAAGALHPSSVQDKACSRSSWSIPRPPDDPPLLPDLPLPALPMPDLPLLPDKETGV